MDTFEVADGVYGIDFELFDAGVGAVYLLDDDEPTLVDAGTAAGVDAIVDGMAEWGVEPADLSHLVCSHVHVDHSGGASALVEANPDVEVYIHESTVDHLVDPGALVASSRRAMGDLVELMGEHGPVPRENVTAVPDAGATLELGSNTLELLHAPGHSPDHLAAWNPERGLLLASECLGYHFQRADRWVPPATLPNFDVDLVDEAIDRLAELDPDRIAFPHFGVWPDDPEVAFETAARELHRFDERILELYDQHGSLQETAAVVGEELLDLAPPYDDSVERFYRELLTAGFLRHHGIE